MAFLKRFYQALYKLKNLSGFLKSKTNIILKQKTALTAVFFDFLFNKLILSKANFLFG